MPLKKYTIAEFRMNTREAFNEVEAGGKVFITRHSTRYELIKAPIQGGKVQMASTPIMKNTFATASPNNLPGAIPSLGGGRITTPSFDYEYRTDFPNNGDAGAQIDEATDLADVFGPATPEKNIAEADASIEGIDVNAPVEGLTTPQLRQIITSNERSLARIDIDTQDPDEQEKGAEIAALLEVLRGELKKRGA